MIEIDNNRLNKVKADGFSCSEAQFLEPVIDLSAHIDGYHHPRRLYESLIPPGSQSSGLLQSALTSMTIGISYLTKPLLLYLLKRSILRHYKDIFRKTGIKAGGELKAAIEEASLRKVPIVLGDRNVDETINRLFESLIATVAKSK
jgi:hypothetical protein